MLDDINKSSTDVSAIKKEWSKVADKFVTHKWIYRYIKDEKQKEMLQRHYANLTDDDTTYGQYKKSFAFVSQFFGLPKQEIIIEWLEFQPAKNNEPERVALRYSKGLYKVNLPADVRLIHIAPVDNIKELQPAFRTKTKGKFMYPSKRVFFTVGKAINPFKNGMVTSKNPLEQLKQRSEAKIFKYTTKADKVGDVYIDPTYNQVGDSSVMVITEKPIPVMKFQDKMEQIFASLKKMLPGGKKEEKKEEKVEESFDLDAFMEAADIKEYDFRQFMSWCSNHFPEQYRKGMSRFEEDDDEELEDFLQGYSKTLAVGYFDCRRISRDGKVITEEITPTIRKFCKEATEQSKLFKLYISDAGGYDIFLDIKRKESTNEATWYDNEAQELVESFDYDYESIDEGALKDFIETIKNWKTSNDAHSKKVVKSDAVSDEDYEKLKNAIEIVKKPDVKYNEYIKAFTDICTFCHTIPAGTIITKYDIHFY